MGDGAGLKTENEKLIGHVSCIFCKYDLFGHLAIDVCPECGKPLEPSVSPTRLSLAPGQKLRQLRFGLRVWLAWLFALCAALVLSFVGVLNYGLLIHYVVNYFLGIAHSLAILAVAMGLTGIGGRRAQQFRTTYVALCVTGLLVNVVVNWPFCNQNQNDNLDANPGAFFMIVGLVTIGVDTASHFDLAIQMKSISDRVSATLLIATCCVYQAVWLFDIFDDNRFWKEAFILLGLSWVFSVLAFIRAGSTITKLLGNAGRCHIWLDQLPKTPLSSLDF